MSQHPPPGPGPTGAPGSTGANQSGKPPPGSGQQTGGFNWDPLSWVENTVEWTGQQVESTVTWGWDQVARVANFTASFIRKIPLAVMHAINVVTHIVEGVVLRVVGILHHMIADLFVLVHDAANAAHDANVWINNAASWFVSKANSWGHTFMADVVQPAINTAQNAVQAGLNTANVLITNLQNDYNWVKNTAIPDAESAAHTALNTANEALNKAAGFVTKDVFDPIVSKVDSLTTEVASLAAEIPADLVDVLDAVKAGIWLVQLAAEYTPEVVQALASAFEGERASSLAPSRAQLATTESDLDRFLHSLLG